MKRIILILFVLGLTTVKNFGFNIDFDYSNTLTQIDSADTVFFHFDKTVVTGNVAVFPVSFSSDDTIYSLDFSFRYNVDSVNCDTIQELTNYIESYYFYNTNDSTLRYTSFSLQPYTADTMLIAINFNLGNSTDTSKIGIFEMKGYLNGNQCPTSLVVAATTGINENNFTVPLEVYPNPSNGIFKVKTIPGAQLQIYDSKGNLVLKETANNNGIKEIDINKKNCGLYIIKVINNNQFASYRILKN